MDFHLKSKIHRTEIDESVECFLIHPLLHTSFVYIIYILGSSKDLVQCSRVCTTFKSYSNQAYDKWCSDISQGKTLLKIQAINYLDKSFLFPNFIYCSKFIGKRLTDGILKNAILDGCQCESGYCTIDCECLNRNPSPNTMNDIYMPFECHKNCSCSCNQHKITKKNSHSCQNNRSIKRNMLPLVVTRRNASKGWQLECHVPLQKGDAVVDYFGEFISTQEAIHRQIKRDQQRTKNGNYILTFEEKFPKTNTTVSMSIDAESYGSLGRFVNHSCSPNLLVGAVRQESLIPSLIFFANRYIEAGEELTIDYGHGKEANDLGLTNVNDDHPCHCGAPNCRGTLPYHV